MKLIVVGGNRGTGAALVLAARAAGHSVTCVSRSGSKSPMDGVRDVRGDARDVSVLSDAFAGGDAVVVTVGAASGSDTNRTDVTRAVVQAMASGGPRRLVVQSSLGVGDSMQLMPGPARLVVRVVLGKALGDHTGQEDAVRASALDWTIVRPGGLSDGPATGSYLAQETAEALPMKSRVSRNDLAAYLLTVVGDASTFGRALAVGTPMS